MIDEFTTEMHAEMLEGEETFEDVMIMGVFGSMRRYGSLKRALKDYPSVTADMFKSNVVRVVEFDSWSDFLNSYGNLLDT